MSQQEKSTDTPLTGVPSGIIPFDRGDGRSNEGGRGYPHGQSDQPNQPLPPLWPRARCSAGPGKANMGKTQACPEAIHSPVGKRDINKELDLVRYLLLKRCGL